MIGIGGGFLAGLILYIIYGPSPQVLLTRLIEGITSGPLSLLVLLGTLIVGVLIGGGRSESRREAEYRRERRRRNAEDRATAMPPNGPFGGIFPIDEQRTY